MKTPAVMMTAALLATALAASPAFQSGQRGVSALPRNFVSDVTNPRLPLSPGTTFLYEGVRNGVVANEDVAVLHEKRAILGIECTVVDDKSFEDRVLVEESIDFYAQDEAGNVWNFGADVRQFDSTGRVIGTSGSWKAGELGARPGIAMEADPKVGDRYEQEDAPFVAEGRARVLSLSETVTVPYGKFDQVLKTQEFSRLERGVFIDKYYADGVGLLLTVGIKGISERIELVSITKG